MTKTVFTLITWLTFSTIQGQNLQQHQWQNRILILKTTDEFNEQYQSQLQHFKSNEKALKERKLILYKIVGERYQLDDFLNHPQNNLWHKLDSTSLPTILSEAKKDFDFFLIGLDGTTKLHELDTVSVKSLCKIIDRMPMRQEELNNRN